MITLQVLIKSHPIRELASLVTFEVPSWDVTNIVFNIIHLHNDVEGVDAQVSLGRPQTHRLTPGTFIFHPPDGDGLVFIAHVDRQHEHEMFDGDWKRTGWSYLYDEEDIKTSTCGCGLRWLATVAHHDDNDDGMWNMMSIYATCVVGVVPNMNFPHKIIPLPMARDCALAVERGLVDVYVWVVVWKLLEMYASPRSIVFHKLTARDVVLCWLPNLQPMLAPMTCTLAFGTADWGERDANVAFIAGLVDFIDDCRACLLLPSGRNAGVDEHMACSRIRPITVSAHTLDTVMKGDRGKFATFIAEHLPPTKRLEATLRAHRMLP